MDEIWLVGCINYCYRSCQTIRTICNKNSKKTIQTINKRTGKAINGNGHREKYKHSKISGDATPYEGKGGGSNDIMVNIMNIEYENILCGFG